MRPLLALCPQTNKVPTKNNGFLCGIFTVRRSPDKKTKNSLMNKGYF